MKMRERERKAESTSERGEWKKRKVKEEKGGVGRAEVGKVRTGGEREKGVRLNTICRLWKLCFNNHTKEETISFLPF